MNAYTFNIITPDYNTDITFFAVDADTALYAARAAYGLTTEIRLVTR